MGFLTWTHGSHGSHGSHSQHISHSVHSVHSNSDSHSNSISQPSMTANSHTSTIGDSNFGSFDTNTQLGVYGGTGSLSAFSALVDELRSRITSTSYTDNASMQSPNSDNRPSLDTHITGTASENLIKAGSGTFNARYQPYTLTVNATGNYVSGGNNPISNNSYKSGHSNTSKTQSISGTASSQVTSWNVYAKGYRGDRNTSYTVSDTSLHGVVKKAATDTTPSYTKQSAGTKITAAHAADILTALRNEAVKAYTGPASKSFSFSGTTQITHSNHVSHSSHGQHSVY